MKKNKNIHTYSSFDEDFVRTANQEFCLPDNYSWTDFSRRSGIDAIKTKASYAAALAFGWLYAHLHLHAKLEHCEKRECSKANAGDTQGCMLFCNHTQPLGDPFLPALAVFPQRAWTIVSPSNLAIPVIGKLLPRLGALPIPNTMSKMKTFSEAISKGLRAEIAL